MWLRNILTFVQLLSAACIIGLVLLQRGKGADAGAGFGAGASGTVFGARGATTALSRATAIIAAIFMVNSLVLAYLGTRTAAQPQHTILDEVATPKVLTVPATGSPVPVPASAPAVSPAVVPAAAPSVPAPAPK